MRWSSSASPEHQVFLDLELRDVSGRLTWPAMPMPGKPRSWVLAGFLRRAFLERLVLIFVGYSLLQGCIRVQCHRQFDQLPA